MRLPKGYGVIHHGTTENEDGTYTLQLTCEIARWRMCPLYLRALSSVRVRFTIS